MANKLSNTTPVVCKAWRLFMICIFPISAHAQGVGAEPELVATTKRWLDNAVDGATGTVKVKARFENKSEALWPGAFVNVALKAETMKDAVVIPTVAIIQTARGAIVYVNEGGKAASRPVVVVVQESEESVVTGVKPGDRVVTEGRQNLRPDAAIVEREASVGDKKMGKDTPGEKDKGAPSVPILPASAVSQVAP